MAQPLHPLDRPVWASLSAHHLALSEGGALARRYRRDVNLFASGADDGEASNAALANLVTNGESVFVLQVPEIVAPAGLVVAKEALGVQLVAQRAMNRVPSGADIAPLGDGDAAEMLALATLTEPGPFLPLTHRMGRFIGVRLQGRLAAMAGERMRFPGFTEVSGVCTHPDFRGRGLARTLSMAVAANIEARGDVPFLHAWKTNVAAISLYESLGFAQRCEVRVNVLSRPAS